VDLARKMNNSSGDYSDQLEGNVLACAPGNEAPGLEILCTVGLPLVGVGHLVNGLGICFIASVKWRHQRKTTHMKPAVKTKETMLPGDGRLGRSQYQQQTSRSFVVKLMCSIGASALLTSMSFLLHGCATMYPREHIRSQIGDVASESNKLKRCYNCTKFHEHCCSLVLTQRMLMCSKHLNRKQWPFNLRRERTRICFNIVEQSTSSCCCRDHGPKSRIPSDDRD
jgi:hypothetical protein